MISWWRLFDKLHSDLEKGEFSIVVVGEFSAGKSTLLNALMGERILPSFSNETTATVNFLRHIEKSENGEAGRVYYKDGTQKVLNDLSFEAVEQYVSTKGDDVANTVEHLDLYLDSDFLKDGVTLVDSPGLNGIKEGHKEITETQILKSHASIFLFNSDHPGSKTDFEFLHDLHSKVKTIIFVLNKVDKINPDEGETPKTVAEYLMKSYKSKFPEEETVPEIWPVSAFKALAARNPQPLKYNDKLIEKKEDRNKLENESNIKEFENRLISFLTCGEKAKQELLSPVDRVIELTASTRKNYIEEKNALDEAFDSTEIDTQMDELKKAEDELNDKMKKLEGEVRTKVKEATRDVKESLSASMAKLQELKLMEIDEYSDIDELADYLEQFENKYIQRVKKYMESANDELNEKIINLIMLQYSSQANEIEEKINSQNLKINLSVSEHLQRDDKFFKCGLEQMNDEFKKLEEQYNECVNQAKEANMDALKARENERHKADIQRQIKENEGKIERLESITLPEKKRHEEIVYDKKMQGGLFGVVRWVLAGSKEVEKKVMVEDDSEYKEAKEKIEKNINSANEKIEELRKQLKVLNSNSKLNFDEAENIRAIKEGELDEASEKLKEAYARNNAEIIKKNQDKIRKIKRDLKNYCDYISDELNKEVKKNLNASERLYVGIVKDCVGGALKAKLNENQDRLEKLEQKLKSSVDEKKANIEALNGKISQLDELINAAVDIQSNIENIQVDEIQQTRI
jgi:GTPase Era involved in 16S rRNA processing